MSKPQCFNGSFECNSSLHGALVLFNCFPLNLSSVLGTFHKLFSWSSCTSLRSAAPLFVKFELDYKLCNMTSWFQSYSSLSLPLPQISKSTDWMRSFGELCCKHSTKILWHRSAWCAWLRTVDWERRKRAARSPAMHCVNFFNVYTFDVLPNLMSGSN